MGQNISTPGGFLSPSRLPWTGSHDGWEELQEIKHSRFLKSRLQIGKPAFQTTFISPLIQDKRSTQIQGGENRLLLLMGRFEGL